MQQDYKYYEYFPRVFIQTKCPICQSEDLKPVTSERNRLKTASQPDVQIFDNTWIQLLECNNCTFAFTKEMPVDEFFFEKRYDIHFNPELESKNQFKDKIIEKLFNDLKDLGCEKGNLLDIGSFAGVFLRKAMAKGFNVQGIEVNRVIAEHARDVQKLNVIHGKFLDTDLPLNHYDLITLIDVLEHLRNPLLSIKKCHTHLKSGGLLVIKVPNFKIQLFKQFISKKLNISDIGILEGFGHINHFTPKSLKFALEANGYVVIDDFTADSEMWGENTVKHKIKNLFRTIMSFLFKICKNVSGFNLSPNFTIIARKK